MDLGSQNAYTAAFVAKPDVSRSKAARCAAARNVWLQKHDVKPPTWQTDGHTDTRRQQRPRARKQHHTVAGDNPATVRKPDDRLSLLSARPMITFPSAKHHPPFGYTVPNYTARWQRHTSRGMWTCLASLRENRTAGCRTRNSQHPNK